MSKMISVVAVALLALARAAQAHQPLSAAADDNDCALYLSGPGRTSAFDYNLNLLRGNFGYDGQHTCITYDAVNQAYLDARKRINVAQPKGDWKAEDIASVGELMLDISISLARTYGLTYEEIEKGLPLIDTAKTLIREACPPVFSHVECRPGKYRRFDGLCNNLQHPTWGATMAPFQRLIGPLFADGINAPRISTSGHDLPLSRVVSRTMHPDDGFHDHAGTVMVIAWGQFMDHDYTLTATPLDPRNRNDPEECCKRPPHLKHPYCNEIRIPDDDYFYRLFHVKCIDFVRGFPSPRPGCRLGSRVPFNTLTGVLDGNTVYGVTEKFARKLRTGFGGLLRMNPVFEEYGLKDLLPLKLDIPDEGCTRPNKSMFCFEAGEIRVNEQLVLTCMHTLMAREHNRVAKGLSKVNPHWDDETLFQEARRINIAEIQHITFNEFLPILLGKDVMEKFGLLLNKEGYWDGYDQSVNPDVIDSFASAAYRFGHSLLPTAVERWSKAHKFIASKRLSDLIRRPYDLYRAGVFDEYLMGLMNQVAQAMDDSITQEVTNHLFKKVGARFGMDLVSFNMQRGREFGVPGYMEFRKFCGLPGADTFQELFGSMPNETIRKYESIFEHPSDVDLWSGGVSERPLPGSMLGPTFACIIATQFSYSRRGDRFWYELPNQPSSFTPEQLVEVRKARLSRIICDNTDIIDTVQVYPMVLPDHELNPRVPCRSGIIPSMDFSKWAEHPHAFEGSSGPSRSYFTEALFSNETLELDADNCTLSNDQVIQEQDMTVEIKAESCENNTDVVNTTTANDVGNNYSTTPAIDTTGHIQKYVVKVNKTESQEIKSPGHPKNVLKRKKRATSGIFDPHPGLATLPLRIITDDDFYPIVDGDIFATSKPVIKENLKATAPQVFPEFTPVPVLPPGYLERYNVSTEINHPAANITKEKLNKPEPKSSSKSLPKTNYNEDDNDDDDDDDGDTYKQKFNNLKLKSHFDDIPEDKFRPYNTHDRGNKEFEEDERPQNSHHNKKSRNHLKPASSHKKIKNHDYSEDENDKDIRISTKSLRHRTEHKNRDEEDEETQKSPHKTYTHSENNKKPSQNYNFDHKHSSNNYFSPTHNSKNISHRSGRIDNNEEHDDNDENIKSANYDSKQNSKAKYEPTNERYNSKHTEHEKSQSSKQNSKSSSPDYADEPAEGRRKQTYSEDKNTDDDDFQPKRYPPNTKNYLIDSTKPLFKPKDYIKSDISHKIKNEEDDSEDNNDRNLPHKSKLRPEHSDSSEDEFIPSGNLNPETYRKFIKEDDASEETAEPKSHNIESNINTFEDGEIQRPPFGKYNEQRNNNEHATPKSHNFNAEDLVDIRSKDFKSNKARNDDSSEDYEEIEENPYKQNADIANPEHAHSGEHTAKSESKPLRLNSYKQKETGEYNKQPANSEVSFHQALKFPSKTKTSHNSYNDQNISEYPKQLPIGYLEENSEEEGDKNKAAIFRENKQPQRTEQEYTNYNQEDTSEEIIHQEKDNRNKKILYDNNHPRENSDLYSKPRNTEAQRENFSENDSNKKKSYLQSHGDEPHTDDRNDSEENVNEDKSKEKEKTYEFYKQQRPDSEHLKQSPDEDSEENINNADVNINTEIPYNSKGASDEINKESTNIGSDEKDDDDFESSSEKLSNKNYHLRDSSEEYPSRRPVAFSKENHNDVNGKAKISYETYHPKGTGPARFSAENQGGGHERAKISYETHHPHDTSDEYSSHQPTGFSKRTHDDGNINAKISYETHHPQGIPNEYSKRQNTAFSEEIQDNGNIKAQEYKTHHPQGSSDQYPKHKPSELTKEYKDEETAKSKISYETYHPPEASINLKYQLNPTEASNENFDQDHSNKAKLISYETYHPQGNTHKYSQQISAEPRENFNQAPVIKNGEIAYETYHPSKNTNEYAKPKIISNDDVNQGSRNIEPKTYDQIHNEAETPADVPNYDGKTALDILKPLLGKNPKKYKPIYQDYNKFNPYKSLYPAAGKNLPKLPVFYDKKHSELPDLTIKTPQGNVKQQFEKIPLDYMHDSHRPRKSNKSHNNNLRRLDSAETSEDNEDARTDGDEEDSGSNEQSKKYKYADDKIKLADVNLGLPEIKLPESVLGYYDTPKNEKSEAKDDPKENYRVKEEDSDDEKEEESEEDESEEEAEEEDESPPQSEEGDDHPRSQASKQPEQDDLYGKFFNDNVDLYESFVRDNFNKEGTFEERSQKITEDPVLKKTMQDVLQHVSKNTRDAEKSKDPKYGYMWTLNYGRPL